MTEKSDPFRVEVRLSLSMIAGVLDHLNELVDEKTVTTEQELGERFAEIEKHVNQIRAEARTAQDELKRLMEEEKFELNYHLCQKCDRYCHCKCLWQEDENEGMLQTVNHN